MELVFFSAVSLFCATMITMALLGDSAPEAALTHCTVWTGLETLGIALLLYFAFSRLHKKIRAIAHASSLTDSTRQRFLRHYWVPYLVFLMSGLMMYGLILNLVFILLLVILFITAEGILLWLAADAPQKEHWLGSLDAIPILFFISGFAALIYQVVWQRVLFSTFGINIESVTVIVSVFMLGLGLGALAGGWLQKRFPYHVLECFIAIEIAIGIFGLFSIPLIQAAGRLAPPDSLPALIGITYALLAFPTMLMGATLPLLVTHLQRQFGNLGKTVGKLYAYNTFGSALAAFLTVCLLFIMFGRQGTLVVACACNVATAWLVYCLRAHKNKQPALAPIMPDSASTEAPYSFGMALLLSAMIGYASLSLEILWFRVLGFMTGGKPQVFGLLLSMFLAGVAGGSLQAKRHSEQGKNLADFIFRSLLGLAIVAYAALPWVSAISGMVNNDMGKVMSYVVVGLLAYMSGGIFPALCHMGIPPRHRMQPGGVIAWMYFCNIVGATLGSLITGFILLNRFGLQQNMAIVCAVILMPLALLLATSRWPGKPALPMQLGGLAAALLALWLHPFLYERMYEKLQGMGDSVNFKYISETRSGIITVEPDAKGDAIYGNGAYDGRFNIDPIVNSNGITRAYMLASFHPHPKRILEIGMSGGAWARILTMYQPLDELVSIEINPGYVDMIAHYPDIAAALAHPKMHLYLDDGRRWLMHHPDDRFDAIVMNATYYWRSNATNLLSRDFLEICKRHLNPGGMVYYNHTGARDSIYTAAHVFKHVVTYDNIIAASDTPFDMSYAQRRKNLLAFIDDNGHAIFANSSPQYQELLEKLAREPLPDIHDSILSEHNLWLITDDNMASEYKIGTHFLPASFYEALHE